MLLTLTMLEGGARLALALLDDGGAPVRVGWKVDGGRSRVRDLVYVPDTELFFRLRPSVAVVSQRAQLVERQFVQRLLRV